MGWVQKPLSIMAEDMEEEVEGSLTMDFRELFFWKLYKGKKSTFTHSLIMLKTPVSVDVCRN